MKTENVKTHIVQITMMNVNETPTAFFEGEVVVPVRAKQGENTNVIFADTEGRLPMKSIGYSIVSFNDSLLGEDTMAFAMEYEFVIHRELDSEKQNRYIRSIVVPTLSWILIETIRHAESVSQRVEKAYQENPESFRKAQALLGRSESLQNEIEVGSA